MKPDLQPRARRFISTPISSIFATVLLTISLQAEPLNLGLVKEAKGIHVVTIDGFATEELDGSTLGNILRKFTLRIRAEESVAGKLDHGARVEVTGTQAHRKNELSRRFEWGRDFSKWASIGYGNSFHDYNVGDRFIVMSSEDKGLVGVMRPSQLCTFDPVTLGDVKAVRDGGGALLEGNRDSCTGLRIAALVSELYATSDPAKKESAKAGIIQYLGVCRAEDLPSVTEGLSDVIFVPVKAAQKKGIEPADDFTNERPLLAEAFYQCASRLPEVISGSPRMKSILKRHQEGGARLQKAELDAAARKGNAETRAKLQAWFPVQLE